MARDDVQVRVYLPEPLKDRLSERADRAGRSLTEEVRQRVLLTLEQEDDPPPRVRVIPALAGEVNEHDGPAYRSDEIALLSAYRALPAEKRALVLAILKLVQ